MIQRCRGHLSPRIVSPLPLLIKQTLLEALPSTYSETFPMTFIIRKIHLSSFLQIFFFFFSITFYPVRFEIYISLSSLFLIFMNIRLETMFERLTLPLPPPPPPCLISNVQFCIYLRVTHTAETSIFGRDGSMENRTIDPEWKCWSALVWSRQTCSRRTERHARLR